MLSKRTKYGLRALIYLAREQENSPVQIGMIAKHERISQKFLESILLTLRKGGILGSRKGKGGGYYLLQKPEDIKMVTIIRSLEGPIALVPCVSLNFHEDCDDCIDMDNCTIRMFMTELRDCTLSIFNNRSLADLI